MKLILTTNQFRRLLQGLEYRPAAAIIIDMSKISKEEAQEIADILVAKKKY
jgi:hypothetical protein